jgi:RNA polymerase sigma factor (sigma-70 family)
LEILSSFEPGGHYPANTMADDAQLLRHYVESRSEPAFAALVQRHLGLVYHAALRQLGGEAHLAEDVVQGVFILLAEKSPTLLGHPSLAGWLHTATHFKVAHALRAQRRRQAREDAAHAMSELARESPDADWTQIRPVLDEVLLELNASDREAVLLRFFGDRGFAEIGAQLRITENTAHKRVERALEKLRERLARRGVKSTAVALATLFAAQGAHAAPSGLAASVTGAVAASGLPAAAAGGMVFMSTKTVVGVVAVAVILLGGVATHQVNAKRELLAALAATARETAALQAKLRAEEERIARERAAAAVPVPPATPRPVAVAPTPGDRPVLDMNARIAEGRAFLKANPELATAFESYLKSSTRKENADLIAAMKLTDAEAEAFVAVLANGRMQIVGQHFLSLKDGSPAPGEYTNQLKEVIGEERYQLQYRENNRTAPARALADDLTRALYYTAAPMTPAQIEQFKQVVLQTLDDGSLGPRHSGGWRNMPEPMWSEMIKRAGSLLSPAQVAALGDLQQESAFNVAQSAALSAYRKR